MNNLRKLDDPIIFDVEPHNLLVRLEAIRQRQNAGNSGKQDNEHTHQ